MAGAPGRQMKRAVADLVRALDEGRLDDARRAMQDAKLASQRSGLPMPQLPANAAELWEVVVETKQQEAEHKRQRSSPKEARLSDETRKLMIASGELAAERVFELLEDDSLFKGPRRAPPRELVPLLTLAMTRAFGVSPMGAQKAAGSTADAAEPREVGSTLSQLIRAKQQQQTRQQIEADMVDVTPDDDAAPDDSDDSGTEV